MDGDDKVRSPWILRYLFLDIAYGSWKTDYNDNDVDNSEPPGTAWDWFGEATPQPQALPLPIHTCGRKGPRQYEGYISKMTLAATKISARMIS